MAVLDKYIDSNINSAGYVDKLLKALNSAGGAGIRAAFATFEVAAADSDGSVYRIFKDVDCNVIPLLVLIGNDAITAGNDWDLGIYKPGLGVVVDKDLLLDGGDLSSAHALSSAAALSGLSAVDLAAVGKSLRELADGTVDNQDIGAILSYDVALTANTVGSAAGTVSVLMIYAIG